MSYHPVKDHSYRDYLRCVDYSRRNTNRDIGGVKDYPTMLQEIPTEDQWQLNKERWSSFTFFIVKYFNDFESFLASDVWAHPMLYSNLRDFHSQSIIDISSLRSDKRRPSNPPSLHFPTSGLNRNQNRVPARPPRLPHHELCHSFSDDSLHDGFLQSTKQTVDQLFVRTHFNEVLEEIQHTLQPIVHQLREQIERKQNLSRDERFLCLKSCAQFIAESLTDRSCTIDRRCPEIVRLQQVLDRYLPRPKTHVAVQTSDELEIDLSRLNIGRNEIQTSFVPSSDTQPVIIPSERIPRDSSSVSKVKKAPLVTFASVHERPALPARTTDDLTRQKHSHRSVSRAFKQLTSDLHRMNHETPFQAHLAKYHRHEHSKKNVAKWKGKLFVSFSWFFRVGQEKQCQWSRLEVPFVLARLGIAPAVQDINAPHSVWNIPCRWALPRRTVSVRHPHPKQVPFAPSWLVSTNMIMRWHGSWCTNWSTKFKSTNPISALTKCFSIEMRLSAAYCVFSRRTPKRPAGSNVSRVNICWNYWNSLMSSTAPTHQRSSSMIGIIYVNWWSKAKCTSDESKRSISLVFFNCSIWSSNACTGAKMTFSGESSVHPSIVMRWNWKNCEIEANWVCCHRWKCSSNSIMRSADRISFRDALRPTCTMEMVSLSLDYLQRQMASNDKKPSKKKKRKPRSRGTSLRSRSKTATKNKSKSSTASAAKRTKSTKKKTTKPTNLRKRKSKRKKATKVVALTDQMSIPIENNQPPSGGSTEVVLSKDAAKLRTLTMFEPWIKRDELDVRSRVELTKIVQCSSLLERSPGEVGRIISIRQRTVPAWSDQTEYLHSMAARFTCHFRHLLDQFDRWGSVSRVHLSDERQGRQFLEGVLSGILARHINAGVYRLGSDVFDWNGFLDCVRQLAKEVALPLNDFAKKMLTANEVTFHKWQNETDRNSEIGSSPKTTRPWDAKKVGLADGIDPELFSLWFFKGSRCCSHHARCRGRKS